MAKGKRRKTKNSDRPPTREQVTEAVKKYLAEGGQITMIPFTKPNDDYARVFTGKRGNSGEIGIF
ncbi:hypothetical protein KKI24_24350 [bacterium]|nr:hypothetical protein [bacterium]